MSREVESAEVLSFLQTHDRFLILTHKSPDGDTLGTAAALTRALLAMQKQVRIINADAIPAKYQYLFDGIPSLDFEPETIVGTALTKEQLKLVKTGDKDYNFKFESAVLEAVYVEGTEEKAYVYTVKETNSPTDYAAKHYGKKESDAWKYKQDMVNGAGNGEVIINQETGGYELPSTGGPGTRLFTILGSILILLSGTLLWRRRRWV